MRRSLLAVGAAVLVGVTAACGGGGAAGAPDTTLTLVPALPLTSFDPADVPLGNLAQYLQAVYDSVLHLDDSGEPEPGIATEWAYDDALTTLTLTLREGLTFSDGTPLDAAAVAAGILHNAEGTSDAAGQLKDVTGATASDPGTVVVTLGQPNPSLLYALGTTAGMIAAPQVLDDPSLDTTPVGSGPYTLNTARTTAGSTYTYDRNPSYWDAASYPFDTVVLTPLQDATAALNALRSGQADGGVIASSKNFAVAEQAGLTVTTYDPGVIEGIYILDRGGAIVPALADVRVRQAINHAFDRDAIVKTVRQGLATPTSQVFNLESAAFDAGITGYDHDPAKARELMAAAGYPDGFRVSVPDFGGPFPDQQAATVQALADIGITLDLVKVPPGTGGQALQEGKFAMSFFPLTQATAWSTVESMIAPTAPWNAFDTTDPQVDALISTIRTSTGDEQTALFQELNAYLVDQAWFAPWDSSQGGYATKEGITVTPRAFEPVPPLSNFAPAT